MAQTTFVIEGAVNVRVTVNDSGGNLSFTVEVLDTQGTIGDLRALFFDIDGTITNPDFSGPLVTGEGTNTLNLGNGANMNGATNQPFDLGVRLGSPGIGQGDDVRLTSFTLDADETLSIDMLSGQRFGTRLTSVGSEDGPRDDSLKIIDVPDIPCVPVCEDVTVDFEQFKAGQKMTMAGFDVLDGDLHIRVRGLESGESNPDNDAMIFDADQSPPVSGRDDDLLAGDGKVLILSEDDDSNDPDDASAGGVFRFFFSKAVDLTSVDLIDIEEGGQIRALDSNGNLIGSKAIPKTADGVLQTVDLSEFDDVAQMQVRLKGSGALDDLKLEVCTPCSDDLL